MNQRFEYHQRPLPSRLEKWRDEISEMRAMNWPYLRISKWFADEQQFTISEEAVRQFCLVRNIQKNRHHAPNSSPAKPKAKPTTNTRQAASTTKPKKLFEYDDSKPIEIKRH